MTWTLPDPHSYSMTIETDTTSPFRAYFGTFGDLFWECFRDVTISSGDILSLRIRPWGRDVVVEYPSERMGFENAHNILSKAITLIPSNLSQIESCMDGYLNKICRIHINSTGDISVIECDSDGMEFQIICGPKRTPLKQNQISIRSVKKKLPKLLKELRVQFVYEF